VDVLSDDDRRHDLQSAGARAAEPGDSPATTPISSSGRINGRRPKDNSFYIYLAA